MLTSNVNQLQVHDQLSSIATWMILQAQEEAQAANEKLQALRAQGARGPATNGSHDQSSDSTASHRLAACFDSVNNPQLVPCATNARVREVTVMPTQHVSLKLGRVLVHWTRLSTRSSSKLLGMHKTTQSSHICSLAWLHTRNPVFTILGSGSLPVKLPLLKP